MIDALSARLTNRGRSWIVAGMVFCCVLMYLAVWTVYGATHVYDRYQQLPPGASATVGDTTMRLVDLRRTEVVVDGDETKPSAANTVWVVATLELTIPHPVKTPHCTLPIVAAGKRSWDAQTFYDRKLPGYCGDDDHPIVPGKPWRFEQIYEVPTRYADKIMGLAMDDAASSQPIKLLRPPA